MLNYRWRKLIVAGVLLLSLGLLVNRLFDLPWSAHPTPLIALQAQTLHAAAEISAAQLVGDYRGVVQLHFTVAGVYSDTLATPLPPTTGTPEPPTLGAIDLALRLTQSNNTLSGYVSLDQTLVFTKEHTIQDGSSLLAIGPYLNGSFDGANLTLVSEQVATTLGGKPLHRQFRLTGTASATDGSQISGEYRETLWGAAQQPITVLGTFTLQRPVFATAAPDTTNQAPTTVADNAATTPGVAITINVLANDSDVNGDLLVITSVSKPQFGTATTDGKTVTYTPNGGFIGTDSFSYFVSDGHGNTVAGSISVTINGTGGSQTIYLPVIRR